MSDGEKAIETLHGIFAIVMTHLASAEHRPNDTLSRIIALLDPWPLDEKPRYDQLHPPRHPAGS